MERTSSSPKRMAMPSWVARKMICWPSVMRAATSSSSSSMPMAMMPRAMTLEKSLSGGLLDGAFAGGEEDVLAFFFEVADGQDGADGFAGLQVEQAGHGFAFAGGAHVGDFVDLEPVDAAFVGEAEQVGVGGVDDELGDEVFFARLHAEAAGAAAPLLAVGGDGGALEVAGMGDSDGDLFVGDEVFELQLGGLVDDLGAALVAVFVADGFELLDDDVAELLLGGEDGFVLGDVVADFARAP